MKDRAKKPKRRVILDDLLVIRKKGAKRRVIIDHYLVGGKKWRK